MDNHATSMSVLDFVKIKIKDTYFLYFRFTGFG
nr:MAG TPA_asm: hypothetical protein [Caudoviricetes sp.]DAS65178.1 MAG TPA: hypothetical protein [Caudoviricetes sp.]